MIIDLRWWVDSFVLTIVCMLVHNHCNFPCDCWYYSSWSCQRNGSNLMIDYSTDFYLEIMMSHNESHITFWHFTIGFHVHNWVHDRRTLFRYSMHHMLNAFTIVFTIHSNFVTKICLFLDSNTFSLSRCMHEFTNVPCFMALVDVEFTSNVDS